MTSEQTIEFPAGTHDGDEVRISGMGHAGTNGAAGGDLVGRAHVRGRALGRQSSYWLLPDGHCGAVFGAVGHLGRVLGLCMMCFIPFAMGLFMVLSDGVLHRSLLWWKRGAMQFANGLPTVHVRTRVGLVCELLAACHAFAVRNVLTSNPLFAAAPAWV